MISMSRTNRNKQPRADKKKDYVARVDKLADDYYQKSDKCLKSFMRDTNEQLDNVKTNISKDRKIDAKFSQDLFY